MWTPLEGSLIIDLGQLTPGGYSTRLLAELGARVVKVERPGGDPLRTVIPGAHEWLNQGKESVLLDLTSHQDREVFHALVSAADVVVENFRESVASRLGVTWAAVRGINAACSLVSLRADSRHPDEPGHDLTMQAGSGLLGFPGGSSGTAPRLATLDLAAASAVAMACVAAILDSSRSGNGSHVIVGMRDVAASWLGRYAAEIAARGEGCQAADSDGGGSLPERAGYGIFETRDNGWVAMGCLEPHFWMRLVDAVGSEELAAYRQVHVRDRCVAQVNELLAQIVARADLDTWGEIGRTEQLPIAPVRHIPALDDIPATLFQDDDETGGELAAAPGLGEHTGHVLAWLAGARAASSDDAVPEGGVR